VIKYHGTPITPRSVLETIAPNNFCISFSDPRDCDWAMEHGQSVMFDCGAYSIFKRGGTMDYEKYNA
jgi:hypothetical protein